MYKPGVSAKQNWAEDQLEVIYITWQFGWWPIFAKHKILCSANLYPELGWGFENGPSWFILWKTGCPNLSNRASKRCPRVLLANNIPDKVYGIIFVLPMSIFIEYFVILRFQWCLFWVWLYYRMGLVVKKRRTVVKLLLLILVFASSLGLFLASSA